MTISVYNIAKAPMGRFTATALKSAVCSGRRLRHSKQQPWQLPPLSKGDRVQFNVPDVQKSDLIPSEWIAAIK